METGHKHIQSHLFTLRLWPDEEGESEPEWRGKVQHVTSGDVHYFQGWHALVHLLTAMLPTQEPSALKDKTETGDGNRNPLPQIPDNPDLLNDGRRQR